MSSRSLSDLREPFYGMALQWLDDCREAGIDVLVYCTLRDFKEQDALYEQGRTTPGSIVTYARGGQSAHNYGLALDFVPLIQGKPQWKAGNPLYVSAVALASARGLESASKWRKFKEWPHIELPGWKGMAK